MGRSREARRPNRRRGSGRHLVPTPGKRFCYYTAQIICEACDSGIRRAAALGVASDFSAPQYMGELRGGPQLSRHKPWRSITALPVVESDCPVWDNRLSLWSNPMNARSNARWVRRPASGEDRETGPPGPQKKALVAMVSIEPYFHRRNKDGTVDSICTRCYMTASTARNELELPEIEQSHICDPYWLRRWQQRSA